MTFTSVRTAHWPHTDVLKQFANKKTLLISFLSSHMTTDGSHPYCVGWRPCCPFWKAQKPAACDVQCFIGTTLSFSSFCMMSVLGKKLRLLTQTLTFCVTRRLRHERVKPQICFRRIQSFNAVAVKTSVKQAFCWCCAPPAGDVREGGAGDLGSWEDHRRQRAMQKLHCGNGWWRSLLSASEWG